MIFLLVFLFGCLSNCPYDVSFWKWHNSSPHSKYNSCAPTPSHLLAGPKFWVGKSPHSCITTPLLFLLPCAVFCQLALVMWHRLVVFICGVWVYAHSRNQYYKRSPHPHALYSSARFCRRYLVSSPSLASCPAPAMLLSRRRRLPFWITKFFLSSFSVPHWPQSWSNNNKTWRKRQSSRHHLQRNAHGPRVFWWGTTRS